MCRSSTSTPPRSRSTWLCSGAVWLALVTACGSPSADDWLAADYVAAQPAPLSGTLCVPPAGPPAAAVAIRLRLLVGPGVSPQSLASQTRAAQSYFAGYGVSIQVVPPRARRVDIGPLLVGATPGASDRAAVAQSAAAPLRRLVARHSRAPAAGEILVVMVDRIAAADSPLARQLPQLAGLTLSPQLDAAADPERELAAALGLPDDYTPTVLLAARELDRLAPTMRRTTLAHELGHALGLPHHPSPGNLMAPQRRRDCVPGLEPPQLARFAR